MNVLLVGPDLGPPWTEGRKNFVRDLAPRLAARLPVRLLTTGERHEEVQTPCPGVRVATPTRWHQLVGLHRALEAEIDRWRADAVCHFPYGTFHGVRGWANRWSMRRIDRCCARHGVRCLTIPYSITRASRVRLAASVRELILCPGGDWTGPTITLGTDMTRAQRVVRAGTPEPTLLFMAGIQEAQRGALSYVLQERGLDDVVEAAPRLASAGVRVIVASPVVRDHAIREQLQRRFAARAAALKLDLRSEVSVPEVFSETDLYVFPYRVELEQFVPTSVLEAMAAGVPVVLTDLAMLAPLANGGRTAYVYRRGEGEHLAEVALQALADEDGRRERAEAAHTFAVAEWSIERSVDDLVRILGLPGRHRTAC